MLVVFRAECTDQLNEADADEAVNDAKMLIVRRLQQLRRSRCGRQDAKFELLSYLATVRSKKHHA